MSVETEIKKLNDMRCEYQCVNSTEIKENETLNEKNNCHAHQETYVRKQIKIALCLILGNVLCGYTLGWSAPIVPKLKDPLSTPLDHTLTDDEISWTVSSVMYGNILGANIGGLLFNCIGRKWTLFIASCTSLVGHGVQAATKNLSVLWLTRVLTGLGAGCASALNAVYLGEITSPDIRGSVTAMTGIFHAAGSLLVYSIGPYIPYTAVKLKKPKRHYKLGRNQNIIEELKRMVGGIEETLVQINNDSVKPAPKKLWREIVTEKKNRRAFLITTTLFFVQNCGGVFSLILYATTIFEDAQSSVDPNIGTIILGLIEVSGMIVAPLLIDRCGRRFLLMMSTSCCCLSMSILGTYFYLLLTHSTLVASVRWLPLVLLIVYLFTFNLGNGIVPNTITSEMYSPRLRSIGSPISMTISWTISMVIYSCFTSIVGLLGNHGVFWMYAVINGFGFFFTLLVVPETKGKSLVEIGNLLEGKD